MANLKKTQTCSDFYEIHSFNDFFFLFALNYDDAFICTKLIDDTIQAKLGQEIKILQHTSTIHYSTNFI